MAISILSLIVHTVVTIASITVSILFSIMSGWEWSGCICGGCLPYDLVLLWRNRVVDGKGV